MLDAETVEYDMKLLGGLEVASNWVLADSRGNIGHQMSGLGRRRKRGVSGFVALPGWEPENDWQGFVSPEDLPRSLNPECGFFVTANQNMTEFGNAAIPTWSTAR